MRPELPAESQFGTGSDAHGSLEELAARGVRVIAVTIVDNAGVARVKGVPIAQFERSLRDGLGLSPIFNVCTVVDTFTRSATVGGPTGDLRLIPDPAAVRLCAEPGWAIAPADQHTQDGEVFGCCQRSFARRMVEQARERGLELRCGWELEWFLGREANGSFQPAYASPGYGLATLTEVSTYLCELVERLAATGVHVGQVHPEYAPGQLEVSLPPSDPVASADLNVFARHVIRSLSIRHEFRASFSPIVIPEQVGNGGHLHVSALSEGRNVFAHGAGTAWPDGSRGVVPRGRASGASRADGDRSTERRQLPAAAAVSLGGRIRVLGSREPRGRTAPRGRHERRRARDRQFRDQVLRPER